MALLLLWQLIVVTGWIPEDYLPGVPAIARALVEQLSDRDFWAAEGWTSARAVGGLLLAASTAVATALLSARWPLIQRALSPLVQIMLSVPPAALVPISIFALGLDWRLFAFIIWFSCFWSIYVCVENALRATEPLQLLVADSLGYGRWETILKVQLPQAMPEIFTGLRVSAAISLMAAIASEMLAGVDGLGFMLYDTAFSLEIPKMFALLAVAGANGLLLNGFIVGLRRHFAGWHEALALQAQG